MALLRCRILSFDQIDHRGGAVTIGNFDGFHLGHQQLFAEVLSSGFAARVLCTFSPHPQHFFSRDLAAGDGRQELVTPLKTKAILARRFGFSHFAVVPFNRTLSRLTPLEFVQEFLVNQLAVQHVVVGHDWRFGAARQGDVALLQKLSGQFGFSVSIVPPVLLSGVRVSSSVVKAALVSGDLSRVAAALNRRFSVIGFVKHGDGRGKGLGFPTANIHLPGQLLPPNGVYAGFLTAGGQQREAVANIGVRPTFSGYGRQVEVHIIGGVEQDFYGEVVEFEFVDYLRPERKFGGIDELRSQIGRDVEQARHILSRL